MIFSVWFNRSNLKTKNNSHTSTKKEALKTSCINIISESVGKLRNTRQSRLY